MANIADVKNMSMKNVQILAASLILMLTGCQMTDSIQEAGMPQGRRYVAAMEGFGSETRTELDGNQVLWSSGDMIMIFDGNDTGSSYVLDQAYSGRSYGEFVPAGDSVTEGSGEETGAVVAFYPYSQDLTLSCAPDGTLTLDNVQYPSEQKYVSSSFADSSFPMVSFHPAGEDKLQFRNLGGVIHLKVKGKGSVSRVILESNAGELISGNASVSMKQESLPVTTMDDEASLSVSLVCDPPIVLSEDKIADFYFSLPPVEFTSGFTVTFDYGEKGTLTKKTTKPQSVRRSAILHMPEFTLADMSGPFVDLGLSVKWAAWNVGADKPEDYGGYYAWGEVEEKSSYSKNNYVYYDSQSTLYSDIGTDISGTEYDVATVKWGEGWRMPTKEELEELVSECTWSTADVGGMSGHNVKGPNGNSIFIPNTGYYQGTAKYFADDYLDGNFGYCWSSTLSSDNAKEAYILTCGSGEGVIVSRYWDRRMGLPVRPVKD